MSGGLQRQVNQPPALLIVEQCRGKDCEVFDGCAYGEIAEASEDNRGESGTRAVAVRCLREEILVAGEYDAAKLRGAIEQASVGPFSGIVLLRGEHIHAAAAQTSRDREGTWTSM